MGRPGVTLGFDERIDWRLKLSLFYWTISGAEGSGAMKLQGPAVDRMPQEASPHEPCASAMSLRDTRPGLNLASCLGKQ